MTRACIGYTVGFTGISRLAVAVTWIAQMIEEEPIPVYSNIDLKGIEHSPIPSPEKWEELSDCIMLWNDADKEFPKKSHASKKHQLFTWFLYQQRKRNIMILLVCKDSTKLDSRIAAEIRHIVNCKEFFPWEGKTRIKFELFNRLDPRQKTKHFTTDIDTKEAGFILSYLPQGDDR